MWPARWTVPGDRPAERARPRVHPRDAAGAAAVSSLYFRADVRGLDNIPAAGPVLMVGNHSGGTMIADTFVFAQAFYDHFGPERRFHQLAHDLVFKVPGSGALVQRYGTIPASPENMKRALDRDAALLVYPGGDHETYRPLAVRRDRVRRANRIRRARARARHPDRPGGRHRRPETALFLGRGRRLASALQLDRLLRLKVLPSRSGPRSASPCSTCPAHPAAVQDHYPGARPDRPPRPPRPRPGPRRRLPPRDQTHAAKPDRAQPQAPFPGHRMTGALSVSIRARPRHLLLPALPIGVGSRHRRRHRW